jgi:hypothetical protein
LFFAGLVDTLGAEEFDSYQGIASAMPQVPQ